MTKYMVTCKALKKRRLAIGERCGGFVAMLRQPFEVIRLLRHSDDATEGEAFCCRNCGQLHEVRRMNAIAAKDFAA